MLWNSIQNKSNREYKRLTGVKIDIFSKMTDVVKQALCKCKSKRGKKRGRKPKLSVEDQILMLLMYYRENRTFAHIGATYQMSECQCWRIITRIEKIIIKSGLFSLPGKKVLLRKGNIDVVIVDATETPIERPKKNRESIIRVKRNDIP